MLLFVGRFIILSFLLSVLETEVRESLVGLGHTVDILLTLEGGTLLLVSSLDLGGQLQGHGLLTALAREIDEVLHTDALLALGADLGGHLESGATNAAALHLDRRSDVGQSLLPHLQTVLFRAVGHDVDGLVENLVGDGLLTAEHQVIDELGDKHIVELRVGKDDMFSGFSFSHFFLSLTARHRDGHIIHNSCFVPLITWQPVSGAWHRIWNGAGDDRRLRWCPKHHG